MNKLFILYVLCSLLIAPVAMAQSNGNSNRPLCQNFLVESYEFSSNTGIAPSSSSANTLAHSFPKTSSTPAIPGSKNPFIAAALSFVIPGAGEYYIGDQIWRGMIFTGIETGLWIEWFHWNNLGDNSTAAFHAFSDKHWSDMSYSNYLDTTLVNEKLPSIANQGDLHSINRAEATLDSLSITNTGLLDFTHRLIAGGQPEYYDLISTYSQYISGWDNKSSFGIAGSLRTTANNQYGTAENFLWGIIANHFLSAIDAVLLASDHNSRIRLHGDLIREQMPDGSYGYISRANFEYSF